MSQLDAEGQALEVHVMDREVVLVGHRVAVALTAAAAAETARRLAAAAAEARPAPEEDPQASQT